MPNLTTESVDNPYTATRGTSEGHQVRIDNQNTGLQNAVAPLVGAPSYGTSSDGTPRAGTLGTGVQTLQSIRREQDKNIQQVFSEVLRNAGREGYASAEVIESSEPLEVRIQESWIDWYHVERLGRYQSEEAPPDLGESYGNVLTKAYEAGAYVDPKSFLKQLSADELTAVQNAHWLADPIGVDSLSEEGALNLLLPPAAQVDINRDGITQSGRANGIRFPDSNTPAEVATAWDQTTAGMPIAERMTYELSMVLPVLLANFELDANGRVTRVREPGDPDFVNPRNDENYSYVDLTQGRIDHLEYFKNQIDPDRYAKSIEFWHNLQQNLRANGVE